MTSRVGNWVKNERGFTLIELLVVIAIVAVMMGLTVNFVGRSASVQIKKEARHLVAVCKYAYNQAVIHHVPYRIVFDLSQQEYWLEEGSEGFTLSTGPEDELKKKETTATEEGDEETSPPSFVAEDEGLAWKVKFEDEVRMRDVYVAHQEGVMIEGQAFLYFFPGGQTEQAVIHLSNEEETVNYSVVVNPVTGGSRVLAEYVEYESLEEE